MSCQFCKSPNVRRVNADGSPQYENGDKTNVPTTNSKCQCGFKHYWDGRLHDNLPDVCVTVHITPSPELLHGIN